MIVDQQDETSPQSMSLRSFASLFAIAAGLSFAALPLLAQSAWQRVFPMSAGIDLREVTVLGDQFVGVGDVGLVVTSTDGVHWLDRDAGAYESFTQIENFAGGLLVSGAAGSIFQSSDGANWQHRLVGVTSQSLVVTDTVAVAQSSTDAMACYRSTNGRDWERVDLSFTPSRFMSHQGRLFVLAQDRQLYTSLDALGWTKIWIDGPSEPLFSDGLPHSNGEVLVTRSALDRLALYRSNDGLTWIRVAFDVVIQGVYFNGAVFVAVGNESTRFSSPDGQNWQLITDAAPAPAVQSTVALKGVSITTSRPFNRSISDGPVEPLFLNDYLDERHVSTSQSIAYGNGRWVTADGFTSTDGQTWARLSQSEIFDQHPPFDSSATISFAKDRFFLTGAPVINRGYTLWSSNDGITFTSAATFETQIPRQVSHAGGTFLLHDANSTTVLRSTDGTNWTDSTSTLPPLPSNPSVVVGYPFGSHHLLSDGSRFVIHLTSGGLFTSTDGLTWAALESNAPIHTAPLSFTFQHGKYILADSNQVWLSDDAETWEYVSDVPLSSITRAAFTGETLVLTGYKEGRGRFGICAALNPSGIWSQSVQATSKSHRGLAVGDGKTIAAFGTSLWMTDDTLGPRISTVSDRTTRTFENRIKNIGASPSPAQNLTFQWARNTLDYVGATRSTFDVPLPLTTQGSADHYTLKISDGSLLTAIPFRVSAYLAIPPTRQNETGISSSISLGPAGNEVLSLVPRYDGLFASYQWFKNGVEFQADGFWLTLPINAFTTGDRYHVVVTNEIGSDQSETIEVTWPTLESPAIEVVRIDGEESMIESLRVPHSSGFRYQWRHNGVLIPEQIHSTLYMFLTPTPHPHLARSNGFYDVVIYNSRESIASQPFRFQRDDQSTLPTETPDYPTPSLRLAKLTNLSVRATTHSGDAALTLGFVLSGNTIIDATKPNPVLLRSVGPGLAAFGIASPLEKSHLQLFDRTSVILAENSQWNESVDLTPIFKSVGAFPLAPDSLDAALVQEVPPRCQPHGLHRSKSSRSRHVGTGSHRSLSAPRGKWCQLQQPISSRRHDGCSPAHGRLRHFR
jgi:hypothetical protein